MTWRDIAVRFPEFAAWAVQREGPLPDGEVREEDYERLALAYKKDNA
jgi:hypothetical protein